MKNIELLNKILYIQVHLSPINSTTYRRDALPNRISTPNKQLLTIATCEHKYNIYMYTNSIMQHTLFVYARTHTASQLSELSSISGKSRVIDWLTDGLY
jgi:hypothetical protein